jgi:hypothetical protein
LAELCEHHLVYRWICGGVSVGYHTLADFRTGRGAALDGLLTQSVAVLVHEGLADLTRVARDGLKVRAAAGAGSFRRPAGLSEALAQAQAQVDALRSQADEDAGAAGRRQQAARQRAAADRLARLRAARAEMDKLQEATADQAPSRRKDPAEVRASTTDPECRKMKMPDGGFRPAYNVQFATTTDDGLIVGVDVINAGTDAAELPPMLDQVEARPGTRPAEALADRGVRHGRRDRPGGAGRDHGVRPAQGGATAARRRPRPVRP